MAICFQSRIDLSRLGMAILFTAISGPVTTIASQTSPRLQLGISAGFELHGPWPGSVVGPSAAISLNRALASRIHLQSVLTVSGRIQSGGETVTTCPPSGCQAGTSDPAAALGATVELVAYDKPGAAGGYVLGGVGLMRYSGRGVAKTATRGQLVGGLGGVVGRGRHQVFVEARLHRVLAPGPHPKWLAPLRIGWRMQL